jgi:hypothetical protein
MAKEQIEFSLFDYFADSQEGVTEMSAMLNTEPASDVKAGKKSYSYDCGEELSGARKHLAAMSKFSREWYEEIEQDPTQAFEAICKDDLLAEFRAIGLREQGFTSEVAYAIKLIWDRVSQRQQMIRSNGNILSKA